MSDTIIMYENGKAVGGEGHPTNADEITFDNSGTDLVSEEVESAIKEVNAKFDKGSVSVTADGVKTYGQLLTALFALADTSKITSDSYIKIGNNSYRNLSGKTMYTTSYATSSSVIVVTIDLGTPHMYDITITSSNFRVNDDISSVPTNGMVFKLIY